MILTWAEHAAITTAVAVTIAHLLAWKTIRALWTLATHQRRIADLLDTSEPGGLTDLENAIRDLRPDRTE